MEESREPTWLDLYDWRWRVAKMYREREAALRGGEDSQAVWEAFRKKKDTLFASHPQSPLEAGQRADFEGLSYFPYNPALRLQAMLEPVADDATQELQVGTSDEQAMPMRRAGLLRFSVEDTSLELVVYWIDVYGGGLFLPFRDATCSTESYGGGRYLFDTVKGSDFLRLDDDRRQPALAQSEETHNEYGFAGGRVLIDFNYAYNPSCAYDPRWVCPLAPRENWLAVAIRAGERRFRA
jgi:uncharacterized protein (DUF1684 family)